MTVTLVAAVGRNGVIGRDGELPWRLPGDLARFRELTWGHVLVMGRRTYDSIGRPLPGRDTIVVTRNSDWQPPEGPLPQVATASSVSAALARAASMSEQVFVVGGEQIYRETLCWADRLVITWVDQSPDGDAFFPTTDQKSWRETAQTDHPGCSVICYERISPCE